MKNQHITVAFVTFVVGFPILVDAVIFGATIPCKNKADCETSRLPENADCESDKCTCPGAVGEIPRYCTLADIKEESADPPPTSTTVQETSSPQSAPKTSNPAPRTVETEAKKCPTPCPTPFGSCNIARRKCECLEGYVMAVNNTVCLPVALELGSNCTEKEQCQKTIANTICEDEQCVCEEGYHDYGAFDCWKSIKLGEKCNNTKECYAPGAVCDGDGKTEVCTCLMGNTANDNRDQCLPVANTYLDSCQEKSQCLAKIPNSVCIDAKCQCEKAYHFNKTQTACVSYPSLGENCQEDYECDQGEGVVNSILDSVTRFQLCVEGICTCKEAFYRNGDFCTDGAASLVPGFLSILAAILLFSRG